MVDYLHGFVDMHNHILHGIDDGAKTIEDSIDLIKGFSEFGVTNFICTPHIMHNYYPNTRETIVQSFKALENELEKLGMTHINIDFAAEHMIDDNFEHILENHEVIPLRKEYLLIEMSYLQPSINFNNAISEITAQRFYPILAHPERYAYFHQESGIYETLKNQGILFQLNLLSLTSEAYGSSVQKCALRLLEKGLVNFVSSDIHNSRQLQKLKDIKLSNTELNLILPILENTIDSFY